MRTHTSELTLFFCWLGGQGCRRGCCRCSCCGLCPTCCWCGDPPATARLPPPSLSCACRTTTATHRHVCPQRLDPSHTESEGDEERQRERECVCVSAYACASLCVCVFACEREREIKKATWTGWCISAWTVGVVCMHACVHTMWPHTLLCLSLSLSLTLSFITHVVGAAHRWWRLCRCRCRWRAGHGGPAACCWASPMGHG
jgi:hypothetical protein